MGLANDAFKGKFLVSPDNGFSWFNISWMRSMSLSASMSTRSTRTFEDGVLDPQVIDTITPSASVAVNLDDSDVAQRTLIQSMISNGASFMVKIAAEEKEGNFFYIGRAMLSNANLIDAQLGGNQERGFDFGFMSFGIDVQADTLLNS